MLNTAEILAKLKPLEIQRLRDIGDLLQYFIPWSAVVWVALEGNQLAAWRWLYIGVITALLTQVGKFLFDFTKLGKRPDGGNGAMPSGHTSSAFMGAFFYYFQFGPVAAIVPLMLAALTGYSRIFAKRHWLRDVLAAIALAFVVNYMYFTHFTARPLF